MSRRSELGYSIDEAPNIVAKMQIVLLAADISTWGAYKSEGLGAEHPHLQEMAARWCSGQYENGRQREAAVDALRAAWSMYRFLRDVVKLDMNAIEREAKRARWWR